METYHRINGSMVFGNGGKKVCIMGTVSDVESMSFKLHTTDNQTISIKLRQPVQGHLAGLVEVRGVAQGQIIIANEYYDIPEAAAENFDTDAYNTALELSRKIPCAWS